MTGVELEAAIYRAAVCERMRDHAVAMAEASLNADLRAYQVERDGYVSMRDWLEAADS